MLAAGAALLYISENLLQAKKPRKDLPISSKELESIFIELLISNKQNYIIGRRNLKRDLLAKINHANKKIVGDFNLNLLKYMQKRGICESLECFLYENFLPQIILPT